MEDFFNIHCMPRRSVRTVYRDCLGNNRTVTNKHVSVRKTIFIEKFVFIKSKQTHKVILYMEMLTYLHAMQYAA